MTKEEAIYKAKHLRKVHPNICIDAEDFWDTVIAALEQETCEDAISRQAVLEAIRKCHCEEWIKADIGAPIEALTSVTPAEKVGYWTKDVNDARELFDTVRYYCSACGDWQGHGPCKYCPNCGAKMREVEE